MEKVALIVSGVDAEVHIDMLVDDDSNPMPGGSPRRVDNEQMRHMNSLLIGMRKDNQDLRSELARVHERSNSRLNVINRNVIHLLRNPVRRYQQQEQQRAIENSVAENDADEEPNLYATLSKKPKTLHSLWNEFEFGVGNKKAAKDFTARERGKVKYCYHRRKVVWDKVSEMVRCGWSSHEACNKIYEAYGQQSPVTYIINEMRKDKKLGGHPSLRVTSL